MTQDGSDTGSAAITIGLVCKFAAAEIGGIRRPSASRNNPIDEMLLNCTGKSRAQKRGRGNACLGPTATKPTFPPAVRVDLSAWAMDSSRQIRQPWFPSAWISGHVEQIESASSPGMSPRPSSGDAAYGSSGVGGKEITCLLSAGSYSA